MNGVDTSRAVRVAEFCQYVQDKKAVDDKAFATEIARCARLDEGDARYYEQLEAQSRAALKKYQNVGQCQSGAPEGKTLK